ncbi:uncharacterized protein BXZ73DRAFT_110950 [Epithele typhae]|uniref:uncharacterized protein n=1 Tax=Epithele typhae TaxID=378194 RepID=UPI002008A07B|nr:uncharacterized protein BXZ73DRAFT_110950 [Epithele typhae]KAH9905508.1 hypothetical protein BXZ73DRAFT_110950 [Epithele typhae]
MSAHRRESFDGAGVGTMEPISPSSVPGLGFDEDAFEDDRESEGSSLPSAASEVQRRDVDWYHAPLAQAPQHHLEQHQSQVQGSPESEREQPEGSLVTPPGEGVGEQRGPAKKRKMHQCTVCFKMFPRPSGLAMHMNSHAGAKLPGPDVHKAVCGPVERKAAPAHARNFPLGGARLKTFLVHEVKRLPPKLRWVLSALSTRTNAGALPRTANSAAGSAILAAIGATLQNTNVELGLKCSPIDVVAVGSGNACTTNTVCCKNNNIGGGVSAGCVPVTL